MKIVYNYFVFAAEMSGSTVIAQFMESAKKQSFIIQYYIMLEYHAIKPEEMTTDMKLKILENIYVHYPPPLTSPSFYNSHF